MRVNQANCKVAAMCRVLVSPAVGTMRAAIDRPRTRSGPSALEHEDREVPPAVGRDRWIASDPRGPPPRGWRSGRPLVQGSPDTLFVSRRRRLWITTRDAEAQRVPNLVKRDLTAEAPNRLWAADIT